MISYQDLDTRCQKPQPRRGSHLLLEDKTIDSGRRRSQRWKGISVENSAVRQGLEASGETFKINTGIGADVLHPKIRLELSDESCDDDGVSYKEGEDGSTSKAVEHDMTPLHPATTSEKIPVTLEHPRFLHVVGNICSLCSRFRGFTLVLWALSCIFDDGAQLVGFRVPVFWWPTGVFFGHRAFECCNVFPDFRYSLSSWTGWRWWHENAHHFAWNKGATNCRDCCHLHLSERSSSLWPLYGRSKGRSPNHQSFISLFTLLKIFD